jgi:hypothetical protein
MNKGTRLALIASNGLLNSSIAAVAIWRDEQRHGTTEI